MIKHYDWRNLNIRIIIYALILSVIGVLLVYSATNHSTYYGSYYKRQIFGACVGIVCMIVFAFIDYHFILKLWPLVYLLDLALLVATRFMGEVHGGARRWLVLPGIGQIQPSDFTKLVIVVCMAALLGYLKEKLNHPLGLLAVAAMAGPHLLLILLQPDLSTTIVMLAMVMLMLYAAKLSYKIIGSLVGICLPVIGYFVFFLLSHTQEELIEIAGQPGNYQLKRVLSFIWPKQFQGTIYQQQNSIMAIGSGGLLGKGLNTTTFESVKNGNFVSESHTDFIFTIAGEELGFVGCIIIIFLFMALILECLKVAKDADCLSGRLVCVGFATLYAIQSFINIAVATWIMPNTGIPLPFISYGLSSIISMYMSIGIILNVSLQRKKKEKFYFEGRSL